MHSWQENEDNGKEREPSDIFPPVLSLLDNEYRTATFISVALSIGFSSISAYGNP